MKPCEVCGGIGNRSKVLCTACQGTGLVLLGMEGSARYTVLVAKAREKAAQYGWFEDVWEPVDPVAHYPALARTIRKRVTVRQQHSEVA